MPGLQPIDAGFISAIGTDLHPIKHGFIVQQVPTFVGLLDTYPSAAFAYSFRKLRAAYAGSAVRIRASGDNAESDFGFDANGDFDAAGVTSFLTTHGGSGFIVTWYDQSGNGLDVTQSTASAQPAYSNSSINCISTDYLSRTVSLQGYIHTQTTIFHVINQDGANSDNRLLSWAGGPLGIYPTYGDVIYFDFGEGGSSNRVNVAQPGGWDDAWHILECYRDSSDEQGIVVDGSSLVTGTRTDDIGSGSADLSIGDSAIPFVGYVKEVIAWGTDLGSSGRSGARTEINSYYSVF